MPWRRGWLCKWLCGPLWSGRGVGGTLRRVSRYVYVSVDVAVRDCATVCQCAPVVRTSNGHNAPHST